MHRKAKNVKPEPEEDEEVVENLEMAKETISLLKEKVKELENKISKLIEEKEGLNQSKGKLLRKLERGPNKKERETVTKDVLANYFSEAQINYILEFKGHNDDNPRVRWSTRDINRFARLKAHVRICGYNYIRRMNIVPMPSLNIIRRAQKEGKLTDETLAIMEKKLNSRTAPNCVPKSGATRPTKTEETEFQSPKKESKAKVQSEEAQRQLQLLAAAIQNNHLPEIVVRKTTVSEDVDVMEEHTLYTPTPGSRHGTWNDEEFDTILHRRQITGYSRQKLPRKKKRKRSESEEDGEIDANDDAAAPHQYILSATDMKEEEQQQHFTIIEAPPPGLSVHAIPNKVFHLNPLTNQVTLINSAESNVMLQTSTDHFIPAPDVTAFQQAATVNSVPVVYEEQYQTIYTTEAPEGTQNVQFSRFQ